MKLDRRHYSPDVIALNPDLFRDSGPTPSSTTPKRPDTELEIKFLSMWRLCHGPELLRDYTGWTDRKLEIDFYHAPSRVGIEINGGIGKKSGHTSWSGIHRDYDKLLLAINAGIRLAFLGTRHMNDDELLFWISMIIQWTKKEI